ncbi:MAG: hypothetical protein ACJ8AE_05260 [Gemmatimonadaceae bacterium]
MTGSKMPKFRKRIAASLGLFFAVGIFGCKSLATAEERVPIREDPAGRASSPVEELTLIRADSEMFAAVVRAQLNGDDEDYPRRLDRFRYDARPFGTPSGYPETFAGVEGIDPTLSFGRAGESTIERVIENRKEILERQRAPEGGPFNYAQCAGAGVPKPPPPRGTRARVKPRDVHAGCPKSAEYYLTVGLPIRGVPEGLRNMRDTRGRRVSLRGDVWTALVDERTAGPQGWSWSQYAWLFRRNRSGQLELASTVLIGVVE